MVESTHCCCRCPLSSASMEISEVGIMNRNKLLKKKTIGIKMLILEFLHCGSPL